MTESDFTKQFFALTDKAQSLLITAHIKPDDDSIASVLVMYNLLSQRYPNKKIEMQYSGSAQDRWAYFENFNLIHFVPDISDKINNIDLIVLLDGNTYNRFSQQHETLAGSSAKKICIDHHASSPDNFDLAFIKTAPATASLLYDLFVVNKTKIEPRLAELFLLGIVGDTSYFRFIEPSQANLFSTIQTLVQNTNHSIGQLEEYYQPYSQSVFAILQELLKNAEVKTIIHWPPVLVSYLPRNFCSVYKQEDIIAACSKFINQYSGMLNDAPWGIVLYPSTMVV